MAIEYVTDPEKFKAWAAQRQVEYRQRRLDWTEHVGSIIQSNHRRVEREKQKMAELEELFRQLLEHVGEDADRPGLKETPRRAAEAWREWTSGYAVDPDSLLKDFEADGYNTMVIVHNISIVSHCEHHLAPITGTAHIGYIPRSRIVGLSKLARVAQAYSARLQVQERLTTQIADCLQRCLDPLGVGVLIRAEHGCMSSRGVKLHNSVTTTSAMKGALYDEASARSEFLQLCLAAEKPTQ